MSLSDKFGHPVAIETQKNGGDVHKAAKKIARKLTDTDRRLLVHYALVELEGEYRRSESKDAGGGQQEGDTHASSAPARVPVRQLLKNPLDLIWPIANEGRKRIGDWTGEDFRRHAEYHAGISRTYAAKAGRFAAVADELGDRTLEDAVLDLSDDARRSLAEEGLRIPTTNEAAA